MLRSWENLIFLTVEADGCVSMCICVCGYSRPVDNRLDEYILSCTSDLAIYMLQHKLGLVRLGNIFHSAVSLLICFEVFLRYPPAHHCYELLCEFLWLHLRLHKKQAQPFL